MPQSRQRIALVVALVALAWAVLASPAMALAATPGSGLWYWPTGTVRGPVVPPAGAPLEPAV
jgi:hypothetical protein